NRFGLGQVSGSAEVSLAGTSATLDPDYSYGCDVIGTEITVPIVISGVGNWNLQYSVEGEELSAAGSEGETLNISTKIGETITLLFIEDELCEATLDETIELTPNSEPELTVSGENKICENGGEVAVTLDMSGQAPFSITYSYAGIEKDTVVEENSLELLFTQSGSLEILSFSDKNCNGAAGQTHEIEKLTTPTAMLSGNEVICAGDLAELSVQLSGSAPFSFTYVVNGEEQVVSTDIENYIIETNVAGDYTLVAMSDAHCEGNIDGSASVVINELPTAVISGGGEVCGDETALIEVNFTGEGPWTLVYLEGDEEKSLTSTENIVSFEGSNSVMYTLISVSDALCDNEASGSAEIVNAGDNLEASLLAPESVCYGDDIEISIETSINLSSVTWSSNGAGSFISEGTSAATYQPGENETGSITIFAEIANACGSEIIETTIEIREKISPEIVLPAGKLYTNTNYSFNAGDQSMDVYNWTFGDGNFSDGSQAFHEYSNGGIYNIELTVIDEGCEGTTTEEVEIFIIDNLYIPNVFNPDALNDENRVVKVYGENVSEDQFSFRIFNRWGKVMYETSSFAEANLNGWDGRAANNDEKSLNVFSWIVRGKFIGGDEFEKAGTVTLVR
ncbi:MAG: PKD domain-containing protein, partial [Cyclobacteriaceae bacterium]